MRHVARAGMLLVIVIAGCGSQTPTVTQTVANHRPPRPVRRVARVRHCGQITLNQHGSCSFARAVQRAYKAAPGARIAVRSPVSGRKYAMRCQKKRSHVIDCGGADRVLVAFAYVATVPPPKPPPPAATATTAPPATRTVPPPPAIEGPSSTSHATDAQFCTTHQCIANFPNSNGAIVKCVDGEWSHSGGLSGRARITAGILAPRSSWPCDASHLRAPAPRSQRQP